jgi:predicted RNA binding protein YcfA (HicA-like mRNA interferase family)
MRKTITPKQIVHILEQNGFLFIRSKGSHFIFRKNATKQRVIVPMHHKDLPKGTLNEILKQAGITKKDLQ